MAQLKDTIITGDASITGTLYPTKIQGNTLWIPTSSGGTTYGAGTSGQVLKTNGTTVYWASDSNSDTKVTQTATTTSANYEVLFSETADNTTRTEGARKNNNLLFNPSTGNLQATQLNGVAIGSSPQFTDTKNTAGATDTSSKIFLIGATAQTANPQTYSQDTAYVGTDGCLYSNSTKVLTSVTSKSQSVTAGTKASFTQGTFTQGTLPSLTFTPSAGKLTIAWSQGTLPTHAADSFTQNTPTAVSLQTTVITAVS